MIWLFYANIETAVLSNSFVATWFKPSRGVVRQGCPLFLYLFVLSAEMVAAKLLTQNDFRRRN